MKLLINPKILELHFHVPTTRESVVFRPQRGDAARGVQCSQVTRNRRSEVRREKLCANLNVQPHSILFQSPDFGGAIQPRQGKAFGNNPKGIELLDTHLAVSRS